MNIISLHPSVVPLQGGVNFRDQGGYRVNDGRRVKHGMLFRSGTLDELTPQDCQYLTDCTVTQILDYRDNDEVNNKPDIIWQNACYKNVAANPVSTELNANLDNLSNATLKEFNPASFMTELYRRLPFNNAAYRYLVELLKQPDNNGIVQHCAVGKDRTGVGSALVLLILGADPDTVMEDYLITETTLAPYRAKMLEKLAPKLDDRSITHFDYVLSAKPEFLEGAFNEIKQRYNHIDNWLEQEFGLNLQLREYIKNKYLE